MAHMSKVEYLAGELYSSYCESVGGVAFNGDPLPEWDSFRKDPAKSKQVEAWFAVACKSVSALTRRHVLWGAGEPDCPQEIKSPNGEIHTLKCKVCGEVSKIPPFCIPNQ